MQFQKSFLVLCLAGWLTCSQGNAFWDWVQSVDPSTTAQQACPRGSIVDPATLACHPTVVFFQPGQDLYSARRAAVATLGAWHVSHHDSSVVPHGSEIPPNFEINLQWAKTGNNSNPAAAAYGLARTCLQGSLGCAAGLGDYYSDVTKHLLELMTFVHVPLMSYASTSETLSSSLAYPFFSRTVISDWLLARGIIAVCEHFRWMNIGLLYVENEFGASFKGDLVDYASEQSIRIRATTSYYSSDNASLANAMAELRSSRVRVIVMVIEVEELEFVKDQASLAGMTDPSITWILPAHVSWKARRKQEQNPTWMQGTVVVHLNGFEDGEASARMQNEYRTLMAQGNSSEFFQQIPENWKVFLDPEKEMNAVLDPPFGYVYDAVWMMSLALSRSNISLMGTPQWADHLQSLVVNQTMHGCSGFIHLDSSGNRNDSGVHMVISNMAGGSMMREVGWISTTLNEDQDENEDDDDDGGNEGEEGGGDMEGDGAWVYIRVNVTGEIFWRSGLSTPVGSRDNVPDDGFSCAPGSYFDSRLNECARCPPGTFLTESTGECLPCPPGSHGGWNASVSCVSCSEGWFQAESGALSCQRCPPHSSTPGLQSTSMRFCLCHRDYYTKSWNSSWFECAECPSGGSCLGDQWNHSTHERITRPPRAARGFWTGDGSDPDEFVECRRKESACRGGQVEKEGEDESEGEGRAGGTTWPSDFQCSSNYQGRQCNECKRGFHSSGRRCLRCPFDDSTSSIRSSAFYAIMPPLFVLGFFTFLTYLIARFPSMTYSYQTCQIVALVGQFNLRWGNESEAHVIFMDHLSMVNFNIDLTYLDCSLHFSFLENWWVVTVIPFLLVISVHLVSAATLMIYPGTRIALHEFKRRGSSVANFLQQFSQQTMRVSRQLTKTEQSSTYRVVKESQEKKSIDLVAEEDAKPKTATISSNLQTKSTEVQISVASRALKMDNSVSGVETTPVSNPSPTCSNKIHPLKIMNLNDNLESSFRTCSSSSVPPETVPDDCHSHHSQETDSAKPIRWSVFQKNAWKDLVIQSTPAILILLRAAYIPVLSNNLVGMICDDFGGVSYLRYAPEVECWSAGHIPIFAVSVLWLIVFNLGMPIALTYLLLYAKRKKLLSSPGFQRQYGTLYMAYEPGFFWYGQLNFLHMGILTVISVCGGRRPMMQIMASSFVIVFRLCVHLHLNPYLIGWKDVHTTLCHALTAVLVMQGPVFYMYDCANYEFDDPSGKCFLHVPLLWITLVATFLVIGVGFYVDIMLESNSGQKLPEQDKFFFLDFMRTPSISEWLEKADPEVIENLNKIESSLRSWFARNYIHVPFNQFLLAERDGSAPAFLSTVLSDNKVFFDFIVESDREDRKKFLDLVAKFQRYKSITGVGVRMGMARLFDRLMLPFITKSLFDMDDETIKSVKVVQDSWHQFNKPLGKSQRKGIRRNSKVQQALEAKWYLGQDLL